MQYSYTKGLKKGVYTALIVLASLASFAGFADLSIWGFIVTYVQPILGSLTVGGVIAIAINFVKVKWLS